MKHKGAFNLATTGKQKGNQRSLGLYREPKHLGYLGICHLSDGLVGHSHRQEGHTAWHRAEELPTPLSFIPGMQKAARIISFPFLKQDRKYKERKKKIKSTLLFKGFLLVCSSTAKHGSPSCKAVQYSPCANPPHCSRNSASMQITLPKKENNRADPMQMQLDSGTTVIMWHLVSKI